MQYLLMIYSDEKAFASRTPEQMKQGMAAYEAYSEALKKAGVWVGGARLADTDTATTVKVRDGKPQVQDGPFADSKEQLGGYYLIEAKNLDEAIAWASRCPGASHGTMEVRPLWFK